MTAAVTFDHLSPAMAGPHYWEALREVRRHGALVWVESNGGFWAATGYEVVLRVAQDWETFSSAEGVSYPGRPSPDVMPYIMPIDIDPPRQRVYRQQVNPHLTPKAVVGYEPSIRQIADELIDSFIGRGSCDLMTDFARRFPGTVFFRLIVQASDDEFQAVEPLARTLSFGTDQQQKAAASAGLRTWATRVFDRRAARLARGDVIDAVMNLPETGTPFADHEVRSGLQILAQGGIGASASVVGTTMRVLCERPELQARVCADRALVPTLLEECLRLEAPTPLLFRTITRDVEIEGQQLRAGQKVGLFFGAANRDPSMFDHPDEVDLERPHYRHLSFGAGTHRCIGSNLARLQMRVAMEQLITRLSPFRVPDGARMAYSSDQARGLTSMPLEFPPKGDRRLPT